MAKSITIGKIHLKNVRLSYPQLFTAKAFEAGKTPLYSAAFLLDPTNAEHKAVLAAVKAELSALVTQAFGGEKLPADRVCVKDGNVPNTAGNVPDGYKDMVVIRASSANRPVVVSKSKQPLVEGDKGTPYAGCRVNAIISLWAQNNPGPKGGKRINANLLAVQFAADGDAFGVAPIDAEEEFELLGDTQAGDMRAPAQGFDF